MSDAAYELKIWAEGEARDADGRLLNADGNPIEDDAIEDEQELDADSPGVEGSDS